MFQGIFLWNFFFPFQAQNANVCLQVSSWKHSELCNRGGVAAGSELGADEKCSQAVGDACTLGFSAHTLSCVEANSWTQEFRAQSPSQRRAPCTRAASFAVGLCFPWHLHFHQLRAHAEVGLGLLAGYRLLAQLSSELGDSSSANLP